MMTSARKNVVFWIINPLQTSYYSGRTFMAALTNLYSTVVWSTTQTRSFH